MITSTVLPVVVLLLLLAALLTVARLAKGPHLLDRVLALDTLYVLTVASLFLLEIVFATRVYFEAALIIALLGFVGTVAFARSDERGGPVE
jgi:multicomponent K+:H+ antiporter subunit F